MQGKFIIKLKYILVLLTAMVLITLMISNSTTILKLEYPVRYKEYVFKYAQIHNIDPYLAYAIIKAESGFNPDATSRKYAKGLMQITDETGSWGAKSLKIENFTSDRLYEPSTNINIGCWYLAKLMDEFDGDIDLVVAAYNGGSGNVNKWLKDKSFSDSGYNLERIPFKETEKFLKKVKNYYSAYKSIYPKSI